MKHLIGKQQSVFLCDDGKQEITPKSIRILSGANKDRSVENDSHLWGR